MKLRLVVSSLFVAFVAGSGETPAQSSVSPASLLAEVGDLRAPAFVPAAPFSVRRFSSYDRRSTDPKIGTDEGWFANGDQGNFLRVEETQGRVEHVMAEATGPGAIMRIWSADPRGVLRAYLDDGPPREFDFAKLLSGATVWAPNPLAAVAARGFSCFLPIPFAKRMKLTLSEKQVYYHVDVRAYGEGTKVAPLAASPAARSKADVEATAAAVRRLADAESTAAAKLKPTGAMNVFDVALGPNEQQSTELKPAGPAGGVVGWFAVFFATAPKDLDLALRGVVLRWIFDGEDCVDVPLGDFFGAGPGPSPFGSAPLGRTADGVYFSRWPMPFAKSATVEFWNFGAEAVKLVVQTFVEPPPAGATMLRFRANWRQALDVPTRPRRDWNIFAAEGGGGCLVGCSLGVANPVREWWGEGDEKFYVDGEAFPSTFGTGVEDFFGYAWCDPTPFTHALHGQSRCDGPGNFGFTSVHRWLLAERVPWTKSFRFDLEIWHWADCKVGHAATVYWYAEPGVRTGLRKLGAEDLVLPTLPELKVKRVAGALEGERLKVVSAAGTAAPQDLALFGAEIWSLDGQLWWRGAKTNDALVVEFSAPAAAKYKVFAACTKASDYGVHRLLVNGAAAGGDRDFYGAAVAPTGEIDLGVHALKSGANRLEVRCVGKNSAAKPGHMFGLDYLRLQRFE